MYLRNWSVLLLLSAAFLLATLPSAGQQDPTKQPPKKEFDKKGKGPGGFGGPFAQQRKLVPQFDKDGNGWLNADERQAARDFLKKEGRTGGFGFPGKGGPGGKGGPKGFDPSSLVVKALLEALDSDKDGKIAKAELSAGAKKLFADTDKDKKGSLTEEQLVEELNRIFPRPQFGGPKGGPGPKGPPSGPVQLLPDPVLERLNLTAEQKKQLAEIQKDAESKLAKILTDEQKKIVFGGPPGPGGFPGGPGGGIFIFGPGNPLARAIVQRADANKDDEVTQGELTAAADMFFKEADTNKDGKLDEAELTAAMSQVMPAPAFGPPGGFGGKRDPAKPGPRVNPADVKSHPKASLYEPRVLRTLFLEFENKDWEAELADFYKTDVEVPATLVVDGKKYPRVGVHFRGMSSYMMVPAGYKRSLNLSLDFLEKKQRLYGYKTLNLLNSNGDASLLSAVLYSHFARQVMNIAAPKANFVKVVINGESWGVYVSVQQFNKEFVAENFRSTSGARWKVAGSPGAGAGLDYLGDNVSDYKRRYQIKSDDDDKSWKALITLCRTLNETPLDKLEDALKPMLDIDGVLKFLALDVVLSNSDGYWIRASDYNIYRDPKGKFHIIPHDMNEAFQPAMGFGFGGKGPKEGGKGPKGGFGGAGGAAGPDPLVGLDDAKKPLRSRLLAVPSLKARYLEHVRRIAAELDWNKLGPIVAQYRELIGKEIEADTRKLMPLASFQRATADAVDKGPGLSLRGFAQQRREFMLNHPEVKKAGAP